MERLNQLQFLTENPVFQKLSRITNIAAMKPNERQQYDESIKIYRDNLAVYSGAIEQGIKQGREEQNKSTARKMKEKGLSVELLPKSQDSRKAKSPNYKMRVHQ